ncbi:MAG: hypothetical protein JSR88_08610 [Proteobacteria bacterium]|nr:hypothetical protein [Pseudomonadota bacterium]
MKRPPRSKLQLKGIDALLMTREELINAVAEFCKQLREPLPSEEATAGWTEANKTLFLEFFLNLERDLRSKINIPYLPMGRNLDFHGIDGGEFAERVYEISVALNNRKW